MHVLKAFLVASGLAVALALSSDRLCARQETCNHIPTYGSESLLGWIHNADNTCIVTEDGAYVQKSRTYKLHTRAIATGHCTRRGWDCSPLPCECIILSEEDRAVVGAGAKEYNSGPSSPYGVGTMWPVGGNTQTMDSRVPGTTTPQGLNWTPYFLGVSMLRFTSTINITACNLPPGSVVFDRSVNVVQCAPRFDPVLERLPLDGQPITISTPSPTALVTAANQAAEQWEEALSNYGIVIDFTVTTTQSCQPLNSHCIQVTIDNPPNRPDACSGMEAHTGPSGEVDQAMTLYVRPAYSGWSQGFVNHLFAHEIGHVLGLDELEQAECPFQSIMKRAVACNNMTGLTQVPTADDAKTVANTTYGTGSVQSCR